MMWIKLNKSNLWNLILCDLFLINGDANFVGIWVLVHVHPGKLKKVIELSDYYIYTYIILIEFTGI